MRLRGHFVGRFVFPNHFGVVLLVGHDGVEHVAHVGGGKIEQIVVVRGGHVFFGGDDVGAQKLVEVFALLIARVRGFGLVFCRAGRLVFNGGHRAVHQVVEHVVMRLLVLEDLFEQTFQRGIFGLRGVKIVLLHAKFFLVFQFGNELRFLLVQLHVCGLRDGGEDALPHKSPFCFFVFRPKYCPKLCSYSAERKIFYAAKSQANLRIRLFPNMRMAYRQTCAGSFESCKIVLHKKPLPDRATAFRRSGENLKRILLTLVQFFQGSIVGIVNGFYEVEKFRSCVVLLKTVMFFRE